MRSCGAEHGCASGIAKCYAGGDVWLQCAWLDADVDSICIASAGASSIAQHAALTALALGPGGGEPVRCMVAAFEVRAARHTVSAGTCNLPGLSLGFLQAGSARLAGVLPFWAVCPGLAVVGRSGGSLNSVTAFGALLRRSDGPS